MTALRRFTTSVWLILRRLRADSAMAIATVLAMAALIGVLVGIPLYAESASARLLSTEVQDAASDGTPFGYLFSYNRLSGGDKDWGDLAPLNEFIDAEESPFGSAVRAHRRSLTTVTFDLIDGGEEIATPSFASATAFEEAAQLAQGRHAAPATSFDAPIEVVIDQTFAARAGLVVDQTLEVFNRRASAGDPHQVFEITITGIWVPGSAATLTARPEDRFVTGGTLSGSLVVPEQTLQDVFDPLPGRTFSDAQWLVLLDSSTITTDSVTALLDDTQRINRQVDDLVRGARIPISPERSLEGFRDDVSALDRGLALFSLPIVFLLLAVLALVARMRWARREAEVLMLRRRGVRAGRVVAEAVGETVILAVAAGAIGVIAGRFVARLMGRTQSFFLFDDRPNLELIINSRSWRSLVLATLLAAVVGLAPSLVAFRRQSLTASRDEDGSPAAPWIQRSGLDIVAVLGVSLFAWFVLRRDAVNGDLLDDPFVILLPAATAVAGGLLVVRILPVALRGLGALVERTDNTALLLVLRRMSRVSGAVLMPVMMLIITGALAIYTGSLARTLDLQLLDAAHHRVGAATSASADPAAQRGERFVSFDGTPAPAAGVDAALDPDTLDRIWGVSTASRMASLPAELTPVGQAVEPVTFVGVDTASFANVAFWRDDYASISLPALMERLDATPDSILIARRTAQATGVRLGDRVAVSVRTERSAVQADMVVVGFYDQFPRWVPGEGAAPIVGSLVDLEARAGIDLSSVLLFEADDRFADELQTRADLSRLGIGVAGAEQPDSLVDRARQRPDRQGVFGLLTVSFVVALGLTIAGFVTYAVFGFRQQIGEIGVLRALGLRLRSLLVLVGVDLLLVGVVGIGAAAALGVGMARWYLPRLVRNPGGRAPELLPEIDWASAVAIPIALGAVLGVATVGLLLTLRQLRLFQAIKVGDVQ